jgi:hypothetical protein
MVRNFEMMGDDCYHPQKGLNCRRFGHSTFYPCGRATAAAGSLSSRRRSYPRPALAALHNFETYGAGAANEVQQTLELIADIAKYQSESGEKN